VRERAGRVLLVRHGVLGITPAGVGIDHEQTATDLQPASTPGRPTRLAQRREMFQVA
jgi:hypothetical protein